MQAPPRVARPAQSYIDRIATAIDAGARLLVPHDLSWSAVWPQPPADWTAVPGSESVTARERFLAYANRGAIITVQATRGAAASEPAGRPIALITLGPRRVSVADGGDDRFDARWTCDDLAFRLTAGPTTLGTFMKLLLATGWH